MPVKAKSTVLVSVVLILIAHLFIFYFIKYGNQNLTISNLDFYVTGNIINLLLTFFLVTGVILYLLRKNQDYKPVIIFTIISSFLLLLCFLTLFIKIPPTNFYVLEQRLDVFIVDSFFMLYQLVQLLFISFIWLKLFTENNYIFLRVIFNTAIIIIILFLAAYFYIEIKMNTYSEEWQYNGNKNIAVVLGAAVWSKNQPSPTLASRLDKAAKLYKKGIVNKIQLTGSNAPGELSEAEVALDYILKKNVDSSDVLVENETTSTNEQVRFIKSNLINTGKYNNIFIVSDRYHLARVNEISRFYNLKIFPASSELELSFDNKLYNRIRECIALIIFWCFAL